MRRSGTALAGLLMLAVSLAVARPTPEARAAIPGENGYIAYVRSESVGAHLPVIDAEGTSITNLAESYYGLFPQGGSWSPGGTHYAYTTTNNNLIRIESVQTHELVELQVAGASELEWSPDGSKFAFVQQVDGFDEIFTMNTDGRDLKRLTNYSVGDNGEEGNATDPAWSPDGSQIAFVGTERVGSRGQFVDQRGIWLMNADGSNLREVFSDNNADHFGDPDWSPDGTQIAFERTVSGDTDIYIGTIARGTDTNLTDGFEATNPSWSPDGTLILFAHSGDIYRIEPDGGDRTQLVACTGTFNCTDPDWGIKIPPACEDHPGAICGGEGDREDHIIGTSQDDVIYSGEGNDSIDGGGGDDRIIGGGGEDTLVGGGGADIINGGEGNDMLVGDAGSLPNPAFGHGAAFSYAVAAEAGPSSDTLRGGNGDDTLDGGLDEDRLKGGDGLDTILGGAGADTIDGADDKDLLRGGGGGDEIEGDEGNDSLKGQGGGDVLKAGAGVDKMDGGPGKDTCVRSSKKDKTISCERKPLRPPKSAVSLKLSRY